MVRCCIWVRDPSEQIDKQKTLHTLFPACARQVTLSHPQITIALGYFLVAANLLHASTEEANEIYLSLHEIPKFILICGRHRTNMTVFASILSGGHRRTNVTVVTNILSGGRRRTSTTFSCHIWGGEFPVGAHVHPINGARLILRTLYEHPTMLYLVWSPVPK